VIALRRLGATGTPPCPARLEEHMAVVSLAGPELAAEAVGAAARTCSDWSATPVRLWGATML
jgi:hypothetical protein